MPVDNEGLQGCGPQRLRIRKPRCRWASSSTNPRYRLIATSNSKRIGCDSVNRENVCYRDSSFLRWLQNGTLRNLAVCKSLYENPDYLGPAVGSFWRPISVRTSMNCQKCSCCSDHEDNDYQAEQSASATEVASRLDEINVIYADNNAVDQCQQLVKVIQDKHSVRTRFWLRPVEPPCIRSRKRRVQPGIGWGILNREADYIPDFARTLRSRCFAVSPDQEQVGRIQGKHWRPLHPRQHSLYRRPFHQQAANLRSKGMLSTKPSKVEMKGAQRGLVRTKRTSGSHVLAVVEHVESASNSGRRLPERCHGDGAREAFAQPAKRRASDG